MKKRNYILSIVVLVVFVLSIIGVKIYRDNKVIKLMEKKLQVEDLEIVYSKIIPKRSYGDYVLEYNIDTNSIGVVNVSTNMLGNIQFFFNNERASDKMIQKILEDITIVDLQAKCTEEANGQGYDYNLNYIAKVKIPEDFYYYLNKMDDAMRQMYFYIQFKGERSVEAFGYENEQFQLIDNGNDCLGNNEIKSKVVKMNAKVYYGLFQGGRKQPFLDAIKDCEIKIVCGKFERVIEVPQEKLGI